MINKGDVLTADRLNGIAYDAIQQMGKTQSGQTYYYTPIPTHSVEPAAGALVSVAKTVTPATMEKPEHTTWSIDSRVKVSNDTTYGGTGVLFATPLTREVKGRTLIAGSGITITPSGGAITIAATATGSSGMTVGLVDPIYGDPVWGSETTTYALWLDHNNFIINDLGDGNTMVQLRYNVGNGMWDMDAKGLQFNAEQFMLSDRGDGVTMVDLIGGGSGGGGGITAVAAQNDPDEPNVSPWIKMTEVGLDLSGPNGDHYVNITLLGGVYNNKLFLKLIS